MATLKCDCGKVVELKYEEANKVFMADGLIWTWLCFKCGQPWFKRVKEAKEISNAKR